MTACKRASDAGACPLEARYFTGQRKGAARQSPALPGLGLPEKVRGGLKKVAWKGESDFQVAYCLNRLPEICSVGIDVRLGFWCRVAGYQCPTYGSRLQIAPRHFIQLPVIFLAEFGLADIDLFTGQYRINRLWCDHIIYKFILQRSVNLPALCLYSRVFPCCATFRLPFCQPDKLWMFLILMARTSTKTQRTHIQQKSPAISDGRLRDSQCGNSIDKKRIFLNMVRSLIAIFKAT